MTRTVGLEPHLALDYPQDSEVVVSPFYTLRLSASGETKHVEVSFDGGPWQACRDGSGHFWFDWSGYMPGRHEIRARALSTDGVYEHMPPRRVLVDFDDQAQ